MGSDNPFSVLVEWREERVSSCNLISKEINIYFTLSHF